MNIKEYLQQHPQWKKRIHGFIMHPVKTRPYWWIRVWQPFYIKKGRGSVIYSSVRKDLPPFHLFQMGKYSVVEDFSCLNNAVGDIVIGDYCRIGLGNTVIGPIHTVHLPPIWLASSYNRRCVHRALSRNHRNQDGF